MVIEYLGQGRIITAERLALIQLIVNELSGRDDKVWPKKGLLASFFLSQILCSI